jgi:hypothetical protein
MTTELFRVATQGTVGLDCLRMSLSRFSVSSTILGQDEAEFWGCGWRWKTFNRAARASQAERVIRCAGCDSMHREAKAARRAVAPYRPGMTFAV